MFLYPRWPPEAKTPPQDLADAALALLHHHMVGLRCQAGRYGCQSTKRFFIIGQYDHLVVLTKGPQSIIWFPCFFILLSFS